VRPFLRSSPRQENELATTRCIERYHSDANLPNFFVARKAILGWVITDGLSSTTASDAQRACGILHSNTWHQLCAMFADLPNTKRNAMCRDVAA